MKLRVKKQLYPYVGRYTISCLDMVRKITKTSPTIAGIVTGK